MNTISDIFDGLGGPANVARLLPCKLTTACEMKRRSSIPVKYWQALIASKQGKAIGLTDTALRVAHDNSRRGDAA